jgi:hypothetical protein
VPYKEKLPIKSGILVALRRNVCIICNKPKMVHRIRKTENLKNWGQISAKLPHPAGMGMAEGNTIEDFLFIDTQILRCPARDALRRAQNDSTVFSAEWQGFRQL